MATNTYSYGSLGERFGVGNATTKSSLDLSRIKNDANRWTLQQLVTDPDNDANFSLNVASVTGGTISGTTGTFSSTLGVTGATTLSSDVGIGTSATATNRLTLSGNQVILASGELKLADAANAQVGTIKNANSNGSQLDFITGGVTAMTIDSSQRVGIGTTSPQLSVSTEVPLGGLDGFSVQYSNDTKGELTVNPTTGEVRMGATNSNGTYFTTLYANGSEAARIDLSGHLGLRVAPNSNWSTANATLQVGAQGGIWSPVTAGEFTAFSFSHNGYWTGSAWKYIHTNAYAAQYYQYQGGHYFRTAAAGTANADISYSDVLTMLNSGAVGINQASPTHKLSVKDTSGSILRLQGISDFNYDIESQGDGTLFDHEIGSANAKFSWSSSSAELMRLDSTGLGLGTVSPQTSLQIIGTGTNPKIHVGHTNADLRGYRLEFSHLQQTGGIDFTASSPYANLDLYAGGSPANLGGWSGQIRFFTGAANQAGTERVRIDAGGGLKVFGQNSTHNANSISIGQEGSGLAQFRAYGPDTSNRGSIEFATDLSNGTAKVRHITLKDVNGESGVGVGTQSPLARVHTVLGTASSYTPAGNTQAIFEHTAASDSIARVGIIAGQGTGFSVLDFGDSTGPNNGGITYKHETDDMFFATTDGTTKATLDGNGNLGIGTQSPEAPLEVVADPSFGYALYLEAAASGTQGAALRGKGSYTVADAGTQTFSVGNGTIVMVSENNTGDGAMFFCGYAGGTVTLVADPNNRYANSVTAGKISLTTTASNSTITLTNNSGATRSFTIFKILCSD